MTHTGGTAAAGGCRGWGLSIAVVAVVTVAVQQAVSQPEVLRARRIEVVDAAGRTRIGLFLTPDESPRLVLTDTMGRELFRAA